TCTATSMRRRPKRARVVPRPPVALSTTPTSVRDARSAGASPNSMQVSTAIPRVNPTRARAGGQTAKVLRAGGAEKTDEKPGGRPREPQPRRAAEERQEQAL